MKDKHIKAYMKCAQCFAECSPANRAKVGVVIVKDNRIISCGYNAFPAHIDGPCELPNGITDSRVRHAEKNALMGLVRNSESAVGATMFCTLSCCSLCANDIIDAGIVEFVFLDRYRDTSGLDLLRQAGIITRQIELKD